MLVEPSYGLSRDELIPALRERKIDSRPFFHPIDTLPPIWPKRLAPSRWI
ncbi:MAG: hypothetical protein R2911_00405 [Caldilineaceae bacterium]